MRNNTTENKIQSILDFIDTNMPNLSTHLKDRIAEIVEEYCYEEEEDDGDED